MKRLGQVTLAVLTTIVVGGCGMSNAVPGRPVAAARIPTFDTTAPPPSATPSAPVTSVPESTTSSTPAPTGPEAVVREYFDAINNRDYQRAWDLGGKNVGQPYAKFAEGFATTDHDVLTVQSVQGNTVTAELVAVQVDGTQRKFRGTYTVTDGVITRFSVRAVG
ncbi:MAG: hypothetical protein ABW224_25490 [Kibdelosporangium sp.]